MNFLYNNYIEHKLSNFSLISNIERDAIWVADHYPTVNGICLIELSKNHYSTFQCTFSRNLGGKSKLTVTEVSEDSGYSLKDIFDPAYVEAHKDLWSQCISLQEGRYRLETPNLPELASLISDLTQAVDRFPVVHEAVAVQGNYLALLPLLYVLQEKFGKVIVIPNNKENTYSTSRSYIDAQLINQPVHIAQEDFKLFTALKLKAPVLVPLDNATLDSCFFEEVKWREVVGELKADTEIGGVGMKALTFRFSFDAFQNIFVQIFNETFNEQHIVWLHRSPLMKYVKMEKKADHPDAGTNVPEKSSKKAPVPKEKGNKEKNNPAPLPVEKTQIYSENEVSFDGIYFNYDEMKKYIAEGNVVKMKECIANIKKVEDKIYQSDVILCDTNFFIRVSTKEPGKPYYLWIIKAIAKKMRSLRAKVQSQNREESRHEDKKLGYPIFEMHRDVYDEIQKKAKQDAVTAAAAAKRYIETILLQDRLLVIPNVREILNPKAYADPSLKKRAEELCQKGFKVCILSDDVDANIRAIAGDISQNRPLAFSPCHLARIWSYKKKMWEALKAIQEEKKSDDEREAKSGHPGKK